MISFYDTKVNGRTLKAGNGDAIYLIPRLFFFYFAISSMIRQRKIRPLQKFT
jgi:hypothetical protein